MKSKTAAQIRKMQAERDHISLQRRAANAERRWRRKLRERFRRLAELILLLKFLDSAKAWGATVAAQIIANLSRPRPADKTEIVESSKQLRFETARAPTTPVYSGRYFGRRPHLSDIIRDLALPGPSGDEAFSELLKHLPEDVHDWALVMFADGRERAFKSAIRSNRIGAAEAIENMKTAARRWKWEQEAAVRQKKMDVEKKLKRVNTADDHDQEPDGPSEYNPKM
ncbi:hypothetical protein PH547_04200 [Rhizobium sp. CNPSo 3464]|uniref:hypothetical protein n=1 Tax=Rhizobium sp. CNPSo 3464 TaxID=3021406 RepID=UPI002551C55D|nr:hypothetical protein [Rhizobium sp. CNPSo 3464]MDK4738066.1 hypothetical protein [Rhizobium sp. CNPSo 3464]